MGCHTWVYKKINPQPTKEEIKEALEPYLKNLIKRIIIFDTEELKRIQWFVDHCDDIENYRENYEKDINNKVEFLSKEAELYQFKYNSAIFLECKGNFVIYDFKSNAYYENINCRDDMFRCFDYEAEALHSKEETLGFIKNNKNSIENINFDEINKFWDENPDGLIDFG